MALVGSEIIQSRTWLDPHAQPAPKLNHKNVFPITVFDAVRADMYNENSTTLKQALDTIDLQLSAKQPIIPAKPANNIMTYAGIAGEVGSIQIAESVDNDNLSKDRIPTELAIGNYVSKSISEAVASVKITWDDIIGRPMLYNELGSDENALISQKAVSDAIYNIQSDLVNLSYDAICYSNPVIKSRPPEDASDENNNGNLIPDVQWVIDKIIELIATHEEEFMDKLKTILPCFTTPPPDPPKDEVVEGITTETIDGLVEGTVEADPSEAINISGYVMSRIPDMVVTALTEGTAEPEPSGRIVVDDIWIEGIADKTILGIMDGSVKPVASQITIPKEVIVNSGCECPCCTGALYEGDSSNDSSVSAYAMSADMINALVNNA